MKKKNLVQIQPTNKQVCPGPSAGAAAAAAWGDGALTRGLNEEAGPTVPLGSLSQEEVAGSRSAAHRRREHRPEQGLPTVRTQSKVQDQEGTNHAAKRSRRPSEIRSNKYKPMINNI